MSGRKKNVMEENPARKRTSKPTPSGSAPDEITSTRVLRKRPLQSRSTSTFTLRSATVNGRADKVLKVADGGDAMYACTSNGVGQLQAIAAKAKLVSVCPKPIPEVNVSSAPKAPPLSFKLPTGTKVTPVPNSSKITPEVNESMGLPVQVPQKQQTVVDALVKLPSGIKIIPIAKVPPAKQPQFANMSESSKAALAQILPKLSSELIITHKLKVATGNLEGKQVIAPSTSAKTPSNGVAASKSTKPSDAELQTLPVTKSVTTSGIQCKIQKFIRITRSANDPKEMNGKTSYINATNTMDNIGHNGATSAIRNTTYMKTIDTMRKTFHNTPIDNTGYIKTMGNTGHISATGNNGCMNTTATMGNTGHAGATTNIGYIKTTNTKGNIGHTGATSAIRKTSYTTTIDTMGNTGNTDYIKTTNTMVNTSHIGSTSAIYNTSCTEIIDTVGNAGLNRAIYKTSYIKSSNTVGNTGHTIRKTSYTMTIDTMGNTGLNHANTRGNTGRISGTSASGNTSYMKITTTMGNTGLNRAIDITGRTTVTNPINFTGYGNTTNAITNIEKIKTRNSNKIDNFGNTISIGKSGINNKYDNTSNYGTVNSIGATSSGTKTEYAGNTNDYGRKRTGATRTIKKTKPKTRSPKLGSYVKLPHPSLVDVLTEMLKPLDAKLHKLLSANGRHRVD